MICFFVFNMLLFTFVFSCLFNRQTSYRHCNKQRSSIRSICSRSQEPPGTGGFNAEWRRAINRKSEICFVCRCSHVCFHFLLYFPFSVYMFFLVKKHIPLNATNSLSFFCKSHKHVIDVNTCFVFFLQTTELQAFQQAKTTHQWFFITQAGTSRNGQIECRVALRNEQRVI